MKRRPKADIAPSGYEIVVGYVTPFLVILNGQSDHGNVAAFHSLREATDAYPSATVTEGAERKARELGE